MLEEHRTYIRDTSSLCSRGIEPKGLSQFLSYPMQFYQHILLAQAHVLGDVSRFLLLIIVALDEFLLLFGKPADGVLHHPDLLLSFLVKSFICQVLHFLSWSPSSSLLFLQEMEGSMG